MCIGVFSNTNPFNLAKVFFVLKSNRMCINFLYLNNEIKGPVPLTDEHKAYAKRTWRTTKSFGVGVIRFHPLRKSTKLSKICEEWTKVVCSRDVKQMNIGSLVDESG